MAQPLGRRVIPRPRRRWIPGGVLVDGWQTDELLRLQFVMRPLWIAAPLHVHPNQLERVRVVRGRLGVTTPDGRRTYGPGEEVEIPSGTRHTLWNAGLRNLHLVDEYEPPLRTAQWFDEMFTTGTSSLADAPAQAAHVITGYPDVVRWTPSAVRTAAWLAAGAAVAAAATAALRSRP